MTVWLTGLLTFEQAADVLEQVGQIALSDSTAWRQAQAVGAQAVAVEATRRAAATALPTRAQIVPGEAPSDKRMAAALDGGMIHIREEGWKELKVGGVGEIELTQRSDPVTGEAVEVAHTVRNSYVAHLGGPELFGQLLWAEAQARGWSRALATAVLGDGAKWIWNLAKDHFYTSVQIVDWYHALLHLWSVAHWVHGEGTPAAKAWLKAHETLLFEGHADRLADLILGLAKSHRRVAPGLRAEANYFREHVRRMQYLEQRENNYPIGSGLAESGCKQFRTRFVGSGMRWSRTGAKHMLPIRAATMSGRFSDFWKGLQPVH